MAPPRHSIIPAPVSFVATGGGVAFALDGHIILDATIDDPRVREQVGQLTDILVPGGVRISSGGRMGERGRSESDGKRTVRIELNESRRPELGSEGYAVEVDEAEVSVAANEVAGILNGMQTLRQLLPPGWGTAAGTAATSGEPIVANSIPGCRILDHPRFGWRGLMLDVSRHFFPPRDVKAFIDRMAQYKFNVFHWHLTDDHGWRIEIKSLPKLTRVGAWRVERHGRFGSDRRPPEPGEEATYGGFYTQDEIVDIVRYASDRNVTIVPEIDMPGHCMAALAAYPDLSTGKEAKFVNPGSKFAEFHGGGNFEMMVENTLNPADDKVYEFVDAVFTEVADLFPGPYIHMGGDECYHGYWKDDPSVQQFMTKNGIRDCNELQSYFVKRVAAIISSKGKKMIGWDEILKGGLAKEAMVMSWRGMKGGIEAAKMGHEVVMSPTTHAYLDYTQGDRSVENPIYADLSIEKAYTFDPIPEGVDPKLILGGQGNLWTEEIPNLPFAFYMTYPRAFALAEVLWSPAEQRDRDSFIARTEDHFKRFDACDTNICRAVYDPVIVINRDGDSLMCALKNSIPGSKIYYTVDNTYPVQFGMEYSAPFLIPVGDLNLRTQTFRDGCPVGRELVVHRRDLEKRAC